MVLDLLLVKGVKESEGLSHPLQGRGQLEAC